MLARFHYFITGLESCFFGCASSQALGWCNSICFSQNCWRKGTGCVLPPNGSPSCECSTYVPNGLTVCIMEEGDLYLIYVHTQKKKHMNCHLGISKLRCNI